VHGKRRDVRAFVGEKRAIAGTVSRICRIQSCIDNGFVVGSENGVNAAIGSFRAADETV
jgi:hypothetical protein